MEPAALEIIRCPRCLQAQMSLSSGVLLCGNCDNKVVGGGYWDLYDSARSGGDPTPTTWEQRMMESRLSAHVYESLWRPAFVRVFGGRRGTSADGFSGELFVHKNCLAIEEREGPWLDLSCGSGLFSRGMAAAAPSEVVFGVDISPAMLEVASNRASGYPNLVLARADAHELPFKDESFGGVNNAGALHVYNNVEQVFREVWRVLKPGGIYVGNAFAENKLFLKRAAARVAGIRKFKPLEMGAWLSAVGFCDYEEVRFGGVFVFRARRP